jgi:hypothetical protein
MTCQPSQQKGAPALSSSQSRVRYELFVGVASAAATASAVWQTSEKNLGKAITIEQSREGCPVLQRTLFLTHVAPGQLLVVMEATGTGFSLSGHVSGPAGVCRERDHSCTGSLFCPHPCSGGPRRMPWLPRRWHTWQPWCNRSPGLLLLRSMRSWNSA